MHGNGSLDVGHAEYASRSIRLHSTRIRVLQKCMYWLDYDSLCLALRVFFSTVLSPPAAEFTLELTVALIFFI
jgi:hypothetical protein